PASGTLGSFGGRSARTPGTIVAGWQAGVLSQNLTRARAFRRCFRFASRCTGFTRMNSWLTCMSPWLACRFLPTGVIGGLGGRNQVLLAVPDQIRPPHALQGLAQQRPVVRIVIAQ